MHAKTWNHINFCFHMHECCVQIAEVERLQQANMNISGSEFNAIQALSRNFFSPIIVEGSTATYSQPDQKILRLGYIRIHIIN